VLDAEADLSGATWFINSNSSFSPFGSPGGSLTFDNGTAAMTITSSSNVGIGTSAPARRLHVANGQLGAIAPHANTSLVLERNGNNYLQMYTPDANESGLLFGKPSQDIRAAIIADANDSLLFRTGGNATRMTLDAAGNLGIQAVTRRMSFASTDFQSSSSGSGFFSFPVNGTEIMLLGDAVHAAAPVHLPNGAVVTRALFSMEDASPTANWECRLTRNSLIDPLNSANNMALVLTSGSAPSDVTLVEDTSIAFATIDNSTFNYFFYVRSTTSASPGAIFGAMIEYTVPRPLP